MPDITPWRRDAISDIEGAPQTFSSWNNCMQKAYCKWPAIIGIVIGSLIVISILWCLARCLCCGLSCCCSCFSCCDSCCPSGGRNKRSKYADEPGSFHSAPNQGYQPAPAPPVYEPPRFATFDAPTKGSKINDDALPAMPSWDNASSRKVEDTSYHEDVEMGHLAPTTGPPAGVGNGYSGISSAPGTPQAEHPGANYRGTDATNPYASGQELLGGLGGPKEEEAYGSASAYHGIPPSNGPRQGPSPYASGAATGYAQTPPVPGFNNSPYDQPYDRTSPAHELPGYPTFSNNLSSSSPTSYPQQGNGIHASTQPSYTAYAPSSSTRYEPSTSQPQELPGSGNHSTSPAVNRPPSLLQAGRKPVQGSWKAV